jgi:hypothetical protein
MDCLTNYKKKWFYIHVLFVFHWPVKDLRKEDLFHKKIKNIHFLSYFLGKKKVLCQLLTIHKVSFVLYRSKQF